MFKNQFLQNQMINVLSSGLCLNLHSQTYGDVFFFSRARLMVANSSTWVSAGEYLINLCPLPLSLPKRIHSEDDLHVSDAENDAQSCDNCKTLEAKSDRLTSEVAGIYIMSVFCFFLHEHT